MMDIDQYRTVAGIAESHHVVKKSRFFGEATAVQTQTAVKEFITEMQKRNPRASHYCYAYSIGSGRALRENPRTPPVHLSSQLLVLPVCLILSVLSLDIMAASISGSVG